jgi:hypothetical protein
MMLPSGPKQAPLDRSGASVANKASHEFEYEGWKVRVELDAAHANGVVSGHADLYDQAIFKCRLSLTGTHRDGAAAILALAGRARSLIDERRGLGNRGA